jgi:hypothetical protein
MTRNLVVVVSGGALAFALAGAASPAVAWGSVHPAGVTKAKLFMPPPTPVIRDSAARPGRSGPVTIWNPGDPPIIRHSTAGGPARTLTAPPDTPIVRGSAARPGHPGKVTLWNEGDPPTIRHSNARPGHPGPLTLWNPGDPPVITRSKAGGPARTLTAQADTPIIRDSAARLGDPDDGGQ